MKKDPSTNAMRLLTKAGIAFTPMYYDVGDTPFSGVVVSGLLGLDPDLCFKTLCARGARKGVAVFVIPVDTELDCRRAAVALDDKSVALVAVRELVELTGYMRGSVCPVGMKKRYPVCIDETAQLFPQIEISGGARGASIMIAPDALATFTGATFHALTE